MLRICAIPYEGLDNNLLKGFLPDTGFLCVCLSSSTRSGVSVVGSTDSSTVRTRTIVCLPLHSFRSPFSKSPEQIPPNLTYHTEFLPMYTSKPHSKPHFSPQNLISLFLQSSTFGFIFCAIIYSLLLANFGVYLSKL